MSFSKVYVGYGAEEFRFSDKKDSITGVRVILTDDTSVLEGTDDSVLEVYIPICADTVQARAYAQNILTALSSWQYQPYEAGNMFADPASQIGDGVTIQDVYSTIYKRVTRLGAQITQDASAPAEEEVNHEFPWVSGADRREDRKYTDLKDDLQAEIDVQAGLISAKVSKISPSGQTSFSWVLDDDSHTWYANGSEVFRVDGTGAHVKGEITATSGVIGGCTIVNGVLQVQAASIKQLSIGSNFSVDTSGNMTANNATITGTLSVGGSLISASDLYTGAAQSAVNYSTWTTGAGYGANWNGAKSGYGYAADVYASSFHSSGTSYFATLEVIGLKYYYSDSYTYSPISFTLNGTTYHVFGWTS